MQKKENRTLPPTCKNQLKIDYLTEELETIKILEEKVTEDVMQSLMKIIPKFKKNLTSHLILLQELTPKISGKMCNCQIRLNQTKMFLPSKRSN